MKLKFHHNVICDNNFAKEQSVHLLAALLPLSLRSVILTLRCSPERPGDSTRLAVSGVATFEQGEERLEGMFSNLKCSDSIISVRGV